jgi:hypothetical protein
MTAVATGKVSATIRDSKDIQISITRIINSIKF